MRTTSVILVGVGQSLRGDDALGLFAVRFWREMHPETAGKIHLETAENPGLTLLDLIQGFASAVIVDAVKSGASPGTIHRVHEDEIAAFTTDSKSAHGWGIAETLRLGNNLYPATMPSQIILLGMEVGSLEIGRTLSEPVQAGLTGLVAAIQAEIERLLKP